MADRGAIVVVARIVRLDRCVGLTRKRADYIAEGHVGKPGHTVVGGLARQHLITRNGWVAYRAGGELRARRTRQKTECQCR